ncbi:hypothetical protein BKA83DRAFT_2094972 [Pisolithus microcarpus]|nr:hypothetical protein BKA83DRAFT_2094972 [Pisolithus microcarpus]
MVLIVTSPTRTCTQITLALALPMVDSAWTIMMGMVIVVVVEAVATWIADTRLSARAQPADHGSQSFLVDGKRGSCRAIKTTGQGKLTETLFDGTRSKGCRVLQFTQVPLASPNFNAIRRSSFGCALRRSLAYLFAVGRQGWTSYAHASGWLRGRARRPQRRSPSSYTLLLLVSLTFEKNG